MSSFDERLRVFVSSRMKGLEDLRAILHRELKNAGIDAFVYELDEGARSEDPEQVSLEKVDRADLLLLVLGDSWGEITEREYDHARECGKPCLVYERRGGSGEDSELQRFKEKLSGARGVPSRAEFTNAVDLAERAARDVRAWLLREYRRLTATAAEAKLSPSEESRLESERRRLAASSSEELPVGNASDHLAWQLRQWFEALEYPLHMEPQASEGHVDLVIRVPVRRRRDATVLVRAKSGEVQAPDVTQALGDREERNVDQVWLIGPRRVSPAARRVAERVETVEVYTLDELIEEDANFSRYFEWLDKEVRTRGIDASYVPLAASVSETDPAGVGEAESVYEDVGAYVDQWMEDPASEHLSLLGEFGTGKSWFTLKYAYDVATEYRRAQERGLRRPRVPLVVPLRDYARGFKDVGALLTDFVFREHRLQLPYAAIGVLNRLGRLLFLFDGFDEMAARIDRQKMVDNFWSLASVLGPGSKAILTCRTEHFHFAEQARDILRGELRPSVVQKRLELSRFQIVKLHMLDEARLRRVLEHRAEPSIVDAIMANERLIDLAQRPVMVDLLLEALPGLQPERADLAQVYFEAVKRKMERDITSQRTFTSMADKVFFMCELSWEMLSTNQMSFHYKQIPDRIRTYFGAKVRDADEDHWHHDLLSQTMLVRDEDGRYRPGHRSLLEFFVAYKLSAQIGALKGDYVDMARRRPVLSDTSEAGDQTWTDYFRGAGAASARPKPLHSFAAEPIDQLVGTWGSENIRDPVLKELVILLCNQDRMESFIRHASQEEHEAAGLVVARVLEVAASLGSLRAADLKGARLKDCHLKDCDLTGVQLAGSVWKGGNLVLLCLDNACLSNASFEGTTFHDVTMRGAKLLGCRFAETVFKVTLAAQAWCERDGEEILVAVLADGRCFGIHAQEHKIFPVTRSSDGSSLPSESWLLGLRQLQEIPGLGRANFGAGRGPAGEPAFWSKDLVIHTNVTEHHHGDVEVLDLRVTDQRTGAEKLSLNLANASGLGAMNPRDSLCGLSNGGDMALTIRSQGESGRMLVESSDRNIVLTDFQLRRTHTEVDQRHYISPASFSPRDSFIAMQTAGGVDILDTVAGAHALRISFHTNATGAEVDGAVGLPDEIVDIARGENEGWKIETDVPKARRPPTRRTRPPRPASRRGSRSC